MHVSYLFREAVKKHADYNLTKHSKSRLETIQLVEKALLTYDGSSSALPVNVTSVHGQSLENVSAVTNELGQQGVNAKFTISTDTDNSTSYFIILYFHDN